jgi:hypothetical protein
MNTKILGTVLLMLGCCCSCKDRVLAKFEITNMTGDMIDSIYILPDNRKDHFIQLRANAKSTFTTDMTGLPKVDGSYQLLFKLKNRTRGKYFGYYTNGSPLENLTRIYIYTDTVSIQQEYNNY